MSFRQRLLLLLLLLSIVPLVVVSAIHREMTQRLGRRLGEEIRDNVIADAKRQLGGLVADFGDLFRRESGALELALRIQAREAERRLSGPAPARRDILDARSVDWTAECPAGMELSPYHRRRVGDRFVPMPVSYDRQVYYLPDGVNGRAVSEEIDRLSDMTDIYRLLNRSQPDLIYWQYASLESGLHTSYPAHGSMPPGYDPRKRTWYGEALRAGDLIWVRAPIVDASTQTVILTLAMPIRRPDGQFAGVTAIDVPITRILERLELPVEWSNAARRMLVTTDPGPDLYPSGRAVILADRSYQEKGYRWDTQVKLQPLEADDPSDLDAVIADLRGGRSGLRELSVDGRAMLCAYGPGGAGASLVVMVDMDLIVAPALKAEREVLDDFWDKLRATGLVLVAALGAVIAASWRESRRLSRPIDRLTAAAGAIAEGRFETRVDIREQGELRRLGEAFNAMAAGIGEQERMRQSLALAMEIQQHLLPHAPPHLEGFDVVGASRYCDETGGDYYDFIELGGPDAARLGIALGDVTGHGISAALLMTSARAVLRSHAARHGMDLGSLFEAINVHLVRDTGEDRFVTLFYGVLDARERSLTWVSAGQDPPLLIRRGAVRELGGAGIPLGIDTGARYVTCGPERLQSGDVVLIGTDGIWEATDPADEPFGKDRPAQIVRQHAADSGDEIRSAIIRAVSEFRGPAPQRDDITLVVIKAL